MPPRADFMSVYREWGGVGDRVTLGGGIRVQRLEDESLVSFWNIP